MPDQQLNVLIVEDSEDDAVLLIRHLKKADFHPSHCRAYSNESLRDALQSQHWDLVISDYHMPGFSGLEALNIVKATGLDIPFIIVSGVVGEDKAVEVMIAGAHDFILKHNLSRLAPAIRRELSEAQSRRQRALAEQEVEHYRNHLETLVQERTKELQNVQSELLRSERMAILGQLVATVSHELCNPLGVIRNAVFLLKRALPTTSDNCLSYTEIIEREVDTANQIIANLSETTRTKQCCRQVINLDMLLEEVVASIRYPGTVLFHYQRNPKPYTLYADRVQLKQVLSNLLSNAFHAAGKVGYVFVLVRVKGASDVITIIDTGDGIPMDVQQSVFEPLYTTKAKGTGLGLWVSKEIIYQHNGNLRILDNSELGDEEMTTIRQLAQSDPRSRRATKDLRLGACFEVSLPRER